jgi:archaellum component FlaC
MFLENLKGTVQKTEERTNQMEKMVDSLNHQNEGVTVNIRLEIQQQRDDTQDAKDQGNILQQIGDIATQLGQFGATASGIAQLINTLQSIGLFK